MIFKGIGGGYEGKAVGMQALLHIQNAFHVSKWDHWLYDASLCLLVVAIIPLTSSKTIAACDFFSNATNDVFYYI